MKRKKNLYVAATHPPFNESKPAFWLKLTRTTCPDSRDAVQHILLKKFSNCGQKEAIRENKNWM